MTFLETHVTINEIVRIPDRFIDHTLSGKSFFHVSEISEVFFLSVFEKCICGDGGREHGCICRVSEC